MINCYFKTCNKDVEWKRWATGASTTSAELQSVWHLLKWNNLVFVKYLKKQTSYPMSTCPRGACVILLFALNISTGWLFILEWLEIQHTENTKYSLCSSEALTALTQRLQHYCFQCYELLCLLLECLKNINECTILNLLSNTYILMIQDVISIPTK